MISLYVAVGGACGAVMRYWAANAAGALVGRDFPYGTLLVNLLGSFLIGLAYVVLVERHESSNELRGLLIAGVLGGFTTFSAFSYETLALLETAQPTRAIVNVLGSIIGCIVACWLGTLSARQF
ncbi:MAG: fluoride efflux transporter CrcB [Gammaproteobacteria bacterium]